jgi:HSP20 family protein
MSLIRYQDPESTAWSPFNRLTSLRDEVNRLFDISFPGYSRDTSFFSGWSPALDVNQDKDHVYVKVELPGMRKEDINISLHEGMLTISGERKHEDEVKNGESFRSERFFGKFHRSVSLPTQVDNNNVKASYKDGLLVVTIPKAEEAKPKQIEVNVS